MQKAFEKIIEKLKEEKSHYFLTIANTGDEKLDAIYEAVGNAIDNDIEIVKQVAEEYKSTEHINCSTDTSISHRNSDLVINSSHSNEEVCEWRLCDEEANVYDTTCRNPHILLEGSPIDNNYEFCPYCGKKIKVVQPKGE